MKRFVGGIATVILVLGLTAGPLAAQFVNSPFYFYPSYSPGWSINVDVGLGMNDDAKFFDSSPLSYGGQVMVGGAVGYLYAGFHMVDPKDPGDPTTFDNGKSFGGGAALTLYNQGSQGFVSNLQLGVGSASFNRTGTEGKLSSTQGLLGLSAAFVGGSGSTKFEVYGAPRLHMQTYEAEFAGITGRTRWGYGVSGGVNVEFSGFGIYGAIDWYSINLEDEGTTDPEKTSPMVIGFGLMYHFMVPNWGTAHGLIGG
jgi:hypothetical protein